MTESTVDRRTLLARADSIAALIAAERDHGERDGELTPPVVAALKEQNLVNLYLPRGLGGLEADPLSVAEVVERVALADPSAGWLLMVANVPRFIASAWPEALVQELWGRDAYTIASISGNRVMRAMPDVREDRAGYRVSGQTPFASGCRQARWFVTPAAVPNDSSQPSGTRMMIVVPMNDCEVVENWTVLGMRATGSHDVRLNDVFVPAERAVPFMRGRRNRFYGGPLYRCAGRVVFATYVPVSLAVAQGALDELTRLARGEVAGANRGDVAPRYLARDRFARALGSLRSARGYFHDALDTAWRRAQAGDDPTDLQRADLYLAAIHAVQAAGEVVRWVSDAAGSTSTYDRSPLQRSIRDMEVLRQHGFTNEQRYANVAEVYWGEPLTYPALLS